MCLGCVNPMLLNQSLYQDEKGLAGLADFTPSRRGFLAMSTVAFVGAALPVLESAPAAADGRARTARMRRRRSTSAGST